jgi:hypothetical protein
VKKNFWNFFDKIQLCDYHLKKEYMEPEEDNIGELITIRNYGDYAISSGGISHNLYGNPNLTNQEHVMTNEKGDFIFPEVLDKVIKKTFPGIISVEIEKISSYVMCNPYTFDTTLHYTVYLKIKFDYQTANILSADKLAKKINLLFSMTYPKIETAKFVVKTIAFDERNHEQEFFDIFLKKK